MTTESLAAWLNRQLDRREWTQADLARKSGVSQGRISNWLNNKRRPNPASCARLADALGVAVDDLLVVAGHRPGQWWDEDPENAALFALIRKVQWDERSRACIRAALEALINYPQRADLHDDVPPAAD